MQQSACIARNDTVTKSMQFCNQEFKVFNAAILAANGTEVTYIAAKMFERRIIKCTKKYSIHPEVCQMIQPLTNAWQNECKATSAQKCTINAKL